MSIEGHMAISCIINGYDGDHLDWRLVDFQGKTLALNQPDGPLFQNFIPVIGDNQGRWARYRDAIMYDLNPATGVVTQLGNIGPRPGGRAEVLFNPQDGRLMFPTTRPFRGMRPAWPPNNHSGAPSLGETGTIQGVAPDATRSQAVTTTMAAIDSKANRGKYPNGLCPPNAPVRSYDIVVFPALDISGTGPAGEVQGVIYNRFGDTDPNAAIHTLRNDEVDVFGARRLPQQLTIRGNVGDCIDLQYRSHVTDFNPIQDNFSKINMHIHMIHFDITASDGVVVGQNWEQSARPCTDIGQVTDLVSATKDLSVAAGNGDNNLMAALQPVADALNVPKLGSTSNSTIGLTPEMRYAAGNAFPPALGGGLGPTHNVITPDSNTDFGRAVTALEWPARPWEYAHYRWYMDIQMMCFWHPHLGGFLAFPLGVANGIIAEPEGSHYRDRIMGVEKFTHSNKVVQSPITAVIRNDTGISNPVGSPVNVFDKEGPDRSGSFGAYPFVSVEGGAFGGDPELGWALGNLDFEEQTKVMNITAAGLVADINGNVIPDPNAGDCTGSNGRPCGNRMAQSGEDIPLFGKVELRGGPSGLSATDCGDISQSTLARVLRETTGVLDGEVIAEDLSEVLGPAGLTPDNNLKLWGGCPDDTTMGAATGVVRLAALNAAGLANTTLNTARIFNRTNSIYETGGKDNAFVVVANSGGTENADIITTSFNDLGTKPEPSFREAVFYWMDDIYVRLFGGGAFTIANQTAVPETDGKSGVTLRNEPLSRRVVDAGVEQHKVFTSDPALLSPGRGDPSPPLLLANPGDRYLIRSFAGGTEDLHTFRFLGHRFGNERHNAETNPMDSVQDAIGYFYQYELMGGAGASFVDNLGKQHNLPGDYLYYMTIGGIDLADGSWSILRVGNNILGPDAGMHQSTMVMPFNPWMTIPGIWLEVIHVALRQVSENLMLLQ